MQTMMTREMTGMMNLDTYYSRTNSEVSKQEALDYQNIERSVRAYYEGGKSSVNDYIYSANLLLKMVLSKDEKDWLHALPDWFYEMQKGKFGTRTINRLGVKMWSSVFRAFYFTEERWKKEDYVNNVHKLLRLYWLYLADKEKRREEQDKAVKKDWQEEIQHEDKFYEFLQEFFSAWEMLRDTGALNDVFSHIVKMKVDRNYNQQPLFFKFVYQSIYMLNYLGYIFRTNPWEMKTTKKINKLKEKQQCQRLLKSAAAEIKGYVNFLQNHNQALQHELEMYRNAEKYISFMQKIMEYDTSAEIKEVSPFRFKISESGDEALARICKMKDDSSFYKSLDKMVGKIPVVRLMDVMKKRNS